MLFQQNVTHRQHQRVTGVKHYSERRAWFIERPHRFLGKADTFVAFEYGGNFAAVTPGDHAVALAYGCWNVGDLKAAGLARVNRAPQRCKSLHKESADEVGLEAACLSLLHLFFHCKQSLGVHTFLSQSITIE